MRSVVLVTEESSGIWKTQPVNSAFSGSWLSGSETTMEYCFFTAGGFSSSTSGSTAWFISSTICRRRAGSMSFLFKISATWLTSIFGMACG